MISSAASNSSTTTLQQASTFTLTNFFKSQNHNLLTSGLNLLTSGFNLLTSGFNHQLSLSLVTTIWTDISHLEELIRVPSSLRIIRAGTFPAVKLTLEI